MCKLAVTFQCAAALAVALPAAAQQAPIHGPAPITSRSPEASALFLAGRERALNFELPQAQEILRKALALDPDFASALAWLSHVSSGPDSVAQADRALSLAEALPPAERLAIQILHAEKHGHDEQSRMLKRTLADLAPEDWLAQFSMGVQAFYDHKTQGALFYLKRAQKLNPGAAEIYNYLGYELAQQGQFDQGVAMLRKFVELRPADANAYDSLGEVQLLAGQFVDAEASFQKAASMLPDMFMAWAGVAYARALRGDLAGAREVAAKGRAFAKGPQDRFVLDLVAIWSSLASSNAAAAFQRLDEVEAEAQKQKNDLQYVLCALERSRLEAETGRTPAAREHAALSLARAEKARLSGNDQNRIRRAALLVEAVSSARAGMQAQAARALSALEEDLKDAPSNADLRGAVHYARGAIALSQGNAAAAKESLERCSDTDYFCKLALAKAQEAAGDPALASETRAKLLRANARDNLHRGEAPVYLYVHTQLAGTGAAGQK